MAHLLLPRTPQTSHSWSGSDTRPEGRSPASHQNEHGVSDVRGDHDLRQVPQSSRAPQQRNELSPVSPRPERSGPDVSRLPSVQKQADPYRRNPSGHTGLQRHRTPESRPVQRSSHSANTGNPTASLNWISGKVLCSTCHKPHYADSDSSTFDNRTSALLGLLTPSAGYLLRTDFRATSTFGTNICMNCHKGKTTTTARTRMFNAQIAMEPMWTISPRRCGPGGRNPQCLPACGAT